jgi:hypothetical protein
MNRLFATILAVASLVAALYVAFELSPTAKTIEYKVTKMVPEQRVHEYVTQIEVGGESVDVTVPIHYTVAKPVWETRTYEVLPTAIDWLKFGVVVAFLAFILTYMLVVLFWWSRSLSADLRESEKIRDVRSRLNGIVGCATGILLGFIGGQYVVMSQTPTSAPMPFNQTLPIPSDAPIFEIPPANRSPMPESSIGSPDPSPTTTDGI